MEAGARPYALGPHDCADLVEHVVADFRDTPQAAGRSLTLRRNGCMAVDADEEALSRALWNLLDNAAKYSPEGSDDRGRPVAPRQTKDASPFAIAASAFRPLSGSVCS